MSSSKIEWFSFKITRQNHKHETCQKASFGHNGVYEGIKNKIIIMTCVRKVSFGHINSLGHLKRECK